jgi:hypothetical protein
MLTIIEPLLKLGVFSMRDYNETTFDDLPPQLLETISDHISYAEGRSNYNNR